MKIPAFILLAFMAVPNVLIGTSAFASSGTSLDSIPRSMIQTASIYPGEEKMMRCSGFVVDASRGFALTAEHCIVDGQVRLLVDEEPSEVVRTSKWLALVKVKPLTKPPLMIAKKRSSLREPTWGFGWAFGQVYLQFQRHVAGYDDTDLVVDGAFIEGMSGGPVVNERGEVVGLVQGGVPGGAWLSGIEEIRDFLNMKD